jgi:hypothetical protein
MNRNINCGVSFSRSGGKGIGHTILRMSRETALVASHLKEDLNL